MSSCARYGRFGTCDGGGVRPGTVDGAGALVSGGEALLLATRLGSCPTPKASASTITRNMAPAIHPQPVPVLRSAGSYPVFRYIGSSDRDSRTW
jgi:hypothetical protein